MCIKFQTDIQNKLLKNLLTHTKFSPETMKHNLRYFQKRGDSQEEENKLCRDTEERYTSPYLNSDLTKVIKATFKCSQHIEK